MLQFKSSAHSIHPARDEKTSDAKRWFQHDGDDNVKRGARKEKHQAHCTCSIICCINVEGYYEVGFL